MKRSIKFPQRRSYGEFKQNIQRRYGAIEKTPGKINPIFTERPHYGIKEPTEGAVKDE